MIKGTLPIAATIILTASAAAKEPREVDVVPPVCTTTTVLSVQKATERGEPIEGEPGSFQTSAAGAGWMTYANGVSHGTVYRRNVYMEASRPGDKITYCLVKKYVDCPKGDDRGKTFTVKNHRTGKTWEASNGSHICGGA